MLLQLDRLTKRIGGRTLFEDATLQVRAGDRIGLVGANGAGKTTMLRIVAGDESADGGRVQAPRRVRIGMLRQEIDPSATRSVREEASTALAALDALEVELRELETAIAEAAGSGGLVPPELADRYDTASHRFEHAGGFSREARVAAVLDGLGFEGDAPDRPLSTFSGGWLMRVELGKLLLSDPDVLLLDEPTNHLDLPAIQWFEETLTGFEGGVVVVSHDRTFLRKHANRVAEIDGRGRLTVYEGGYDRYLEQRQARREELAAQKANQDREIAHMERFVERFRYKASKAKQAQSRVKALDRMERIELDEGTTRRMRLRIPPAPRAGEIAMLLEGIHKSYAESSVYEGIDAQVRRGDRIALVGPNGAGKSTLLRIIAGALDFDAGERTPGHNVRIAFFAQHQLETLDPERSVLEELAATARTDDAPRLRGHLGAFLFSGDDVEKQVSVLSGGEKARLALAKMLLRPANLLVLDEPTNHLDIQACEVLEEALQQYTGTIVFVSHDRSFINALATRTIEVRNGVLREFPGNYDEYLRKTKEKAGPAANSAQSSPPSLPGGSRATPDAQPERSHKEQRQIDRERRKARLRCTKQIEKLEAEILEREQSVEALGWKLSDPEVYRDADRTRGLEAERSTLQQEIADRYAEWERLADELAALDDAPE